MAGVQFKYQMIIILIFSRWFFVQTAVIELKNIFPFSKEIDCFDFNILGANLFIYKTIN